jgi:maltose O-acetyltransferase
VDKVRGQQNLDRLVAMGLELGERVFVSRDAYLDPGTPWLISIGDQATLGPRVIVLTHDAAMQRHLHRTLLARVVIGRRAFIGAGSIVLPGSTIGEDAIVGAGTVVRGDIPAGAVAIGNPAQVVSDVESMMQKHRRAARDAPRWPHLGWTIRSGISEERKEEQRRVLSSGVRGYLDWPERIQAVEEQEEAEFGLDRP